MTPDLTVAIVSYRTPEMARACAVSIDTGDLRAHVTVMETAEHEHALYPRLNDPLPPRTHSLIFSAGLGYADALDRVLGHSDSPYLIACNADVEFPATSVEPLIDLFEQHPRLALIGPRQVSIDGTRIVHAGVLNAGDTSGGRDYGAPNVGQWREPLAFVPQVSGSIMVLRGQAFREVGGMKRMPHLYFEDAILCHRLRHAGWQVAYSGLLTFRHHVAASPRAGGERAELADQGRRAWQREMAVS